MCVCVCITYTSLSVLSLAYSLSGSVIFSFFKNSFYHEVTEDRLTEMVGALGSHYLLYTLVVERVKEKSLYTTIEILLKPCHGWDKD